MLVSGLKTAAKVVRLAVGLLVFAVSGKTPPFAYQAMISLFCLTRGHSNDLISSVVAIFRRPYQFGGEANGVLGNMAGHGRDSVVADLRTNGYHVFDARLPDALCDRLLAYATSHPCVSRPMRGQGREKAQRVVYPRSKPQAVRYDFTSQDLLDNPDIQRLLADLSFASVAQAYLGARPSVDVLSMWWHTAYSDKPDEDAAQYYHFDMDRPKWLKFFIYLTDVNTDTGPHTFVAGSHRTGGIADAMLHQGYARLTDEEVEQHYGRQRVVEFGAPRGTIIAEDTRGLHKGKHVQRGDRLILQIQFSNYMFGAYYPKAVFGPNIDAELRKQTARFPALYSTYT